MHRQSMIPLAPQVIRRHSRDALNPVRRRREPYNVPNRSAAHSSASHSFSVIPQVLKKMDEATVELMKHLKKREGLLADLLHRARESRLDIRFVDLDLLLKKAYLALQRKFFNDRMAGRVLIAFAPLGLEVSGQTHVKQHLGFGKVMIRINEDLIIPLFQRRHLKVARDQLLATLLHHMIHAYFLVRCGSPDPNKEADGRLRHESHFGAIMYKIKEISAKYGDPLPIDFAHSIPTRLPWSRRNYQTQMIAQAVPLGHDDRHHCTECTSTLDPIDEKKIQKWYQNRCYQTVDPDIYQFNGDGELQSTPLSLIRDRKSEWIELYWQKKILKLDKSSLKFLSSPFAKKFTADNRRVDLPRVPEKTARALWLFLENGEYGPHLASTKNGTRGPALIKGLDPNWTTYIEDEVRIHKLATKLQFDELRRRAFGRLMDMHMTFEDPIPVFTRIYNVEEGGRGAVHEELRKWAIAFMERHADILSPGQSVVTFSNWGYLSKHSGFQYCLDNGGEALTHDFNVAGDSLQKRSMGLSKHDEALMHAAQFPGNAHLVAGVMDGRVVAHAEVNGGLARDARIVAHAEVNGGLLPPPPPPGAGMALQHHVSRMSFPVHVPYPIEYYDTRRGRSRSRSLSPTDAVVGYISSRSPSPMGLHGFEDLHYFGL